MGLSHEPDFINIDETIERRKGDKITAKGVYRDAVRSTQKYVIRCFGQSVDCHDDVGETAVYLLISWCLYKILSHREV